MLFCAVGLLPCSLPLQWVGIHALAAAVAIALVAAVVFLNDFFIAFWGVFRHGEPRNSEKNRFFLMAKKATS